MPATESNSSLSQEHEVERDMANEDQMDLPRDKAGDEMALANCPSDKGVKWFFLQVRGALSEQFQLKYDGIAARFSTHALRI